MMRRKSGVEKSKAVSTTTESGKPRPKPSDVADGAALFPIIWNLDPASSAKKATSLILTAVGLICLVFLSTLMKFAFPQMDSEWDERNGIDTSSSGFWVFPTVIEKALDLPKAWVQFCFQATGVTVSFLLLADEALGLISKSNTDPYPASWKTENTLCYHEMFSEPTRFGRLIRRPGNTLSNATYLLGSLCILASVTYNTSQAFWWADLLFGIMLLILAVSSFLWHGSNGPWTQYVDIWSMDCCILYLIVRNVCMGLLAFLVHYTGSSLNVAKIVAGGVCALIYGALIISIGRNNYQSWYLKGYLHGRCPFSGRARLLGISNLGGKGQKDTSVVGLAVFAAMPVIYYSAPLLIQLLLLHSLGSIQAGDLVSRTLVVGWTYRFFDRWVIDGNPVMNYFVTMKPSIFRTVGAAIFSPTGVLHTFTGITLLAGYVHSRSLDDQFGA